MCEISWYASTALFRSCSISPKAKSAFSTAIMLVCTSWLLPWTSACTWLVALLCICCIWLMAPESSAAKLPPVLRLERASEGEKLSRGEIGGSAGGIMRLLAQQRKRLLDHALGGLGSGD